MDDSHVVESSIAFMRTRKKGPLQVRMAFEAVLLCYNRNQITRTRVTPSTAAMRATAASEGAEEISSTV